MADAPQKLTIAVQKKILAMLDAGNTYEQIQAALRVVSATIARVRSRRQSFREGLVDTQYVGQPLHAAGGTYVPTPEEFQRRLAVIRKRHIEERREDRHVEIQEVGLAELGIWVRGGARS